MYSSSMPRKIGAKQQASGRGAKKKKEEETTDATKVDIIAINAIPSRALAVECKK